MQRSLRLCREAALAALSRNARRSGGEGVFASAARGLSFQSREDACKTSPAGGRDRPFEARRQRRPRGDSAAEEEEPFWNDSEFEASLALSDVCSARHAALWSGLARPAFSPESDGEAGEALPQEEDAGDLAVDEESSAASARLLFRRMEITQEEQSERKATHRELRLRLPRKKKALGVPNPDDDCELREPSLLERLALAEKAALMKPPGKGDSALLPLQERRRIVERETGRQETDGQRRVCLLGEALSALLLLRGEGWMNFEKSCRLRAAAVREGASESAGAEGV